MKTITQELETSTDETSTSRVLGQEPETTEPVQQRFGGTARPETTSRDLSGYVSSTPADVSLLQTLLCAAQELLSSIEADHSPPSSRTARALSRAAATLEKARADRRNSSHLPGNVELLQGLVDLGTEVELTLWDAVDVSLSKLEASTPEDVCVHVDTLQLLNTASECLKRDARAEAVSMRLDSAEDTWSDAELRVFASASSVRDRYREKRARSKCSQAIFDSRRARKEARAAKNPRTPRQLASDERARERGKARERQRQVAEVSSFGSLAAAATTEHDE